jgi:hypothetical protein
MTDPVLKELFSYQAPKICGQFMNSSAFTRIIAGPVGSGKTTACIIELLRRSIQQTPHTDGIRYTRMAVTRQTLRQLMDTVLNDCHQWLRGLGEWKEFKKTYQIRFGDVHSDWMFIPLEDAGDQARLLSMQLTGAWLSECIEMNFNVLAPLSGRIGRYPSPKVGGVPTWSGIIADTNMPTQETPWHKYMMEPPSDAQIFIQPSGVSEAAENLDYIGPQTEETARLPLGDPRRLAQGRTYYERLVRQHGEDSSWVKRYVYAQFGEDPSGQGVFRNTFIPAFHGVEHTLVIPGYPIIIGQDFGRDPWSIICQMDHQGRLIVHEEVPATNVGLEKHVIQSLRPRLMQSKYMGMRMFVVGDPAGVARSTISEETSFDVLKRLGLPAFPAPTNDIDPRLRAVEAILGQQRNAGPALLINKTNAPFLFRAMSGGYRFLKSKAGALRATPDKMDAEGFSHVADTLQYVALVVHGGLVSEFSSRLNPVQRPPRPKISSSAWT